MTTIPTIQDIKTQIRKELRCPAEFVQHMDKFLVFRRMQECMVAGDRSALDDEKKELYQGYRDYCRSAGLDFNADNRKARPGWFIGRKREEKAYENK